jgi:hypothetical protein
MPVILAARVRVVRLFGHHARPQEGVATSDEHLARSRACQRIGEAEVAGLQRSSVNRPRGRCRKGTPEPRSLWLDALQRCAMWDSAAGGGGRWRRCVLVDAVCSVEDDVDGGIWL